MMTKNIVIIPTYNEIDNIENIIQSVFELPENFEILIVDDNSPDGTAQKVQELQNKYPSRLHLVVRPGKLGLGTAYIKGFKWALENNYDIICEMDADFSHDPKDLSRLVGALNNGYDVAIGSRYIQGVAVINWPIERILLSYFASVYVRLITGLKIKDTTAGFIAYKAEVLRNIDLDKIKFKGYAFQIEMKFWAWKKGFRIIELPIIFTERRKGTSKMSKGIFYEALIGVIYLRLKSLFNPIKNFKKLNES